MAYSSVFREGLFAGQVALVTGGGSGIGRCIAHELAALGAKVMLAGRKLDKLETVRAEIQEDGGQAELCVADVREEAQVQALIGATLERFQRLDFVVNNAGGQFVSPAESISLRGFKAVIDTNLTGPFLISREAVNRWMADNGGAIVNIVADMWCGMPMMSHSGAARAGVVNLTKTWALEWAVHQIRVNAVAPGLVASSGFKSYPEPVQQILAQLPNDVPARRFGTESEVSSAVCYLLSPAAAYISGETLCVDGGSSLYRHSFQLPEHGGSAVYNGFHRAADLPEVLLGQGGKKGAL